MAYPKGAKVEFMHRRLVLSSCFFVLVLLLSVSCLPGCSKPHSATCSAGNGLYRSAGFPIGVVINPDLLYADTQYSRIAAQDFNSITPENIFKPFYLHPERGVFFWDEADKLADYCLNHKKRLHGHTLIWHEQLPEWIKNYSGSSAEWEQIFKSHIQTIVAHFKGRVAGWDVVNEAFNDDGTLRNSIWRQKLGDGYIARAFMYAHEADPDAQLFYNDFDLESNPLKRSAVITFLNSIRQQGVVIDGIGLQTHVNIYFPGADEIAKAMQEVAKAGYKVHISELDISINPKGGAIQNQAALYQMQAELMVKIIANYRQLPAKVQYGITVWGISDKDSWIPYYFNREDYPLLYDGNYKPKPVYCALKSMF